MKISAPITRILIIVTLLVNCNGVFAQGVFQNLDFESAVLVPDPSQSFTVFASSAIPGWTAAVDGTSYSHIFYDTVSGSIAFPSIHDSHSAIQPLQGSYSVLLQGAQAGFTGTLTLSQTGLVPAGTQSMLFLGAGGNFQVSLNGQTLSLTPVSSTPSYTVYGANIAWAAGTLSTLQFSVPPNAGLLLDGIQFSTNAVPEPSTLTLLGTGIAVFGFRRRNERFRSQKG